MSQTQPSAVAPDADAAVPLSPNFAFLAEHLARPVSFAVLSASPWSARFVADALLGNWDVCSTQFGITEVGRATGDRCKGATLAYFRTMVTVSARTER